MKIFGREPAMILSAIYAVVSLLSAFAFHWSANQVSLVNAVAAAAMGLILWKTLAADGQFAAIVGFIKAIIALALPYWKVDAQTQAIVMAAIVPIVSALIVRPQVTASTPPAAAAAPLGPVGAVGH